MNMSQELAALLIRKDIAVTGTNEGEGSIANKDPKRSADSLDLILSIGGSLMYVADESNGQLINDLMRSADMHSLIPAIGRDNSIECIGRCSRANYGAIACLNSSFRSLIKDGDIYQFRRQNGIVEHWAYFSCQPLEWEGFDPIARKWISVPKMEHNVCFVHADKESLGVGTEILVFGRDFMAHVIYRYSLLSNTWTTAQSMNQQRCLFASASFGDKAIVAGGCDSQGNILRSAELYDSETQTWRRIEDMSRPRKMCSGAFMDGKFYAIGGIGANLERLKCGDEYDFKTRTWREIPNMSPDTENTMPSLSESPPLIAVVNNELYAAHYADMTVRKYLKEEGRWIPIGSLPENANSMLGWGLAFRGCGDRLVVVSGPRYSGIGFIEINGWVPNEGPLQWELLGRKRSGSFVYNCAIMGC